MSKASPKEPAQRRSNPARSAETRDKVIQAAIKCLYDHGYEGTSINLVAAAAGVSKGATQYHYPSKTDLMLAVADYCLKLHVQMRTAVYHLFPPGPERIEHTAEASWEIINHPSYTALIEIMMATRNSAELKDRCKPLIDLIAVELRRNEDAFYRDFNVQPNPLVKTLIRTHLTMMRGMAVGMMFHPDREAFREELKMMQRYEKNMREQIMELYGTDKDASS